MEKAVFIDRDGVINVEKNYVHKIEDFSFIPGTFSALRILKSLNFRLIIITNQSGIARGFYTKADVDELHRYMLNILKENEVEIDAVYICPHHPEGKIDRFAVNCGCRKPNPGMILSAKDRFNLDLKESILVGDKISDINAGINAGIGLNILVESGHLINIDEKMKCNYVFPNLQKFANWLKFQIHDKTNI